MAKQLTQFEIEMNQEIEDRIAQLENEEYDLGKPFNRADWIWVVAGIAFGLVLAIYGAVL